MSASSVEIAQTHTANPSDRVRFGRNRFLLLLSAGFMTAATKLALATPAFAHPTPEFCSGAPGCHCCSGGDCCESGCSFVDTACETGHCWTVAQPDGSGCYWLYQCCDWSGPAHGLCICRAGPSHAC
jgi:hypothetical protein